MIIGKCFVGLLLLLAVQKQAARAQSRIDAEDYVHYFPQRNCSPAAFTLAARGYNLLRDEDLLAEKRYLTIIDFTKPSNVPRLFVLDIQKKELALRSIVSHGLGSDPDSTTVPYRFSNTDGSRMSSVGFYLTGATYFNFRPTDSLGLCLFGLDSGYNDAAAAREVVVHYGASERSKTVYVTDTGAGRSYGCPALPLSTNTRFIKMVEGGSALFIYSDRVAGYEKYSSVLNRRVRWPVRQGGPGPNFCSCDVAPGKVRFTSARR